MFAMSTQGTRLCSPAATERSVLRSLCLVDSEVRESALPMKFTCSDKATVYIAPDATMSYTVPHSAYIPEGSVVDGWSKTEGESFGHLTFDGGLVACPVEGKPWQVYGQRPNVTLSPECLGFSALTGMF